MRLYNFYLNDKIIKEMIIFQEKDSFSFLLFSSLERSFRKEINSFQKFH